MHGIKKGRTYTLSPTVYRDIGQSAAYVRQVGFDSIQQEQMVLRYVREHGNITRGDVIYLCKVSPDQATRLLRKLVDGERLRMVGNRKVAVYVRA